MKVVSKYDLGSLHIVLFGIYDVEVTPDKYTDTTVDAVHMYMIVCDDGNIRRVSMDWFMSLYDYRNYRIDRILEG